MRKITLPTLALVLVGVMAAPVHAADRQPPTLNWQRCAADGPADHECATLKVPLDYSRPGGQRFDLAVSRIRTARPGLRRGVLALSQGGPGMPGIDQPLTKRAVFPAEVLDRYDLVAIDHRGTGRSTQLRCGLTQRETVFARSYRPATFDQHVADTRSYAAKCAQVHGELLPHLSTRNIARDLDSVRAALGEERLSLYGFSNGGYVNAVYTQLFPARADRVVLDSTPGPTVLGPDFWRDNYVDGEATFERWLTWAASRNAEYGLGESPDRIRALVWDLVARLDRQPVPWQGTAYDGDELRTSLRYRAYTPEAAAELVRGLRQAADRGETGGESGWTPFEGLHGYLCGDVSWPRDPEWYRRRMIENRKRYPLTGDIFTSIQPCAFWTPAREPLTLLGNDHPVLMLQNERDPATPLTGARDMATRLRGARLVLVAGGAGHGVYRDTVGACVREVLTRYLVAGALAARSCPAAGSDQRRSVPAAAPHPALRTG